MLWKYLKKQKVVQDCEKNVYIPQNKLLILPLNLVMTMFDFCDENPFGTDGISKSIVETSSSDEELLMIFFFGFLFNNKLLS